jgi:type VI secretion system protein ImpK
MAIKNINSGFVLSAFQSFYREVIIQRELAERSEHRLGLHTVHPHPDPAETEVLCDRIQTRLAHLLEQFSLEAQSHVSDFASSHYREALYIMVALADEVFLSFEWPGLVRWEERLLEARFFKTQIAGEAFFDNLDSLLHANDPVRNEIAIAYLMAIALGFRGKYLGVEDHGRIANYQKQLYMLSQRENSDLFHPGRELIMPSCYDNTQSIPYGPGLPDLRTWGLIFIGIICAYLFLSSTLWFQVTHDLSRSIDKIMCQAQQLGLS